MGQASARHTAANPCILDLLGGAGQIIMPKMRKILSLLVAPLLLTAAAPPAPQNVPKPALWKVADADTTIYLFGTIHILKPGTGWFQGPVEKAFSASDQLVLEMVEPPPEQANAMMMQHAVDPDGPPLTAKIGPQDADRFRALMASLGINPQALEAMEPWFVATLVSLLPLQKLGFDPDNGVDRALAKAAQNVGKPVLGLETMPQQIAYFDTLPEPDQISLLREALDEAPNLSTIAAEMTQDWAMGRTDDLAQLMNKGLDKTPNLTRVLLTERNQRWADWIAQRLDKPGTVFVAVGAAHLAGKDSVQARLAGRKLQVVRIN